MGEEGGISILTNQATGLWGDGIRGEAGELGGDLLVVGFDGEGGAEGGAGGGDVVFLAVDDAEVPVGTGVGWGVFGHGEFEAAGEGGEGFRRGLTCEGEGAAEVIEDQVVVGGGGAEFTEKQEGLVVAAVADEEVGLGESAAAGVEFPDGGGLGVGVGYAPTDQTGGLAVELEEGLAIVEVGGGEGDGFLHGGAAGAGEGGGAEGEAEGIGLEAGGGAVVEEYGGIGGSELAGAGEVGESGGEVLAVAGEFTEVVMGGSGGGLAEGVAFEEFLGFGVAALGEEGPGGGEVGAGVEREKAVPKARNDQCPRTNAQWRAGEAE